MAEQPTAEEIAAYEAQFGPAPKPSINPLRDLSAEDIAALAVKDKEHFNIPDEFARAKELHGDPVFVQKVADAFNIVNQRGFKVEDLPTVKQAAGAVGTAIKGLAGQAWNYASAAGGVVAGAAAELVGAEGLAGGYAEGVSKTLAKNIAGTEESMTGLSQLAQKGTRKAGQLLNIAKEFSEYTPAEKVTELFDKAGESEVRSERLTGKGVFTEAVTGGQGGELAPEEVGTLAAGDPFSFYLFGAASKLAGTAVKAVTPAIVKGAAAAATQAAGRLAERVVPGVVGGALTAAGVTAKGAAKAVEKVAPAAGAIGGGIAGGTSYGAAGAIAGIGAGLASGKAIAKGAAFVGRQAEKIADVGRQVAGSKAVTSAYTQAGRDFLQALPGAVGDVAKGTALDIGLAAATAEVPQDVQGAVGFGTALGALTGTAKVGGRVLSGQLIAPRNYGVNTVLPSSKQFPVFDTMHADAIKAATPGVRARLNAMRQFAEGVAPGSDVFIGRDAAAVEKALLLYGADPVTAESWSQAEGFFTADLVGKDGKSRRVVIATNVDSVPHEAQHIIQDVLGESANRQVDKLVKDTYADRWDIEGQRYADRLTEGERDPRHWREVILDETNTGLGEAKEKIYRDIYNRLEAESGAPPSPKFVEELAKMDLGSWMDAAVSRHPNADPNAIGQHVWRDVFSDSPGDLVAISDKYIARELAAENFDAIFKSQGPRLAEGTQLPQRLARIIGGVISVFGGEPLAGRVSELGGTPLSTDVITAVRGAAKGLQGETPLVTPRAPATPRVRVAPGSAEAIQDAAEEARTLAASAPAEVAIGGTRSPRELLGQIAESIANQEGVRINYLSAPGEPAAATTSNRTVRREIIEAFRTMPPEARALWEKTFFPDRVIRTKSGAYQVQGWAPEVFAANAHKLAKFLAETPGSEGLSPYAIDVATKTFTPDAWQELYRDTQDFVQNQIRGATGSGEVLVVPKSVTDAGGFAPPTRPGATPLAQNKADFINALFNFKLPETPRIQAGKRPLNVMGQEVSAATIPGRVEVPVRPRGKYTGEEAARQGIEGVNIAEVNLFRNQLEAAAQAAGKPPPSFIEVIQKLNLENIKEVEGVPEVPQFRGNTLTLTAGLQPAIQQRATERSWTISGQVRGANKQITVNAPDIAAARKLAEAQNMRVSRVENADKAVSAQLAPRPVELADRVEKFTPEEFRVWAASPEGANNNFTGVAHDVGTKAPDRAFVDSLLQRYEAVGKKMTDLTAGLRSDPATMLAKLDDISALASQGQFFREAYEAATGTASAGDRLRATDPNYKPPFPVGTPEAQLAPRRAEETRKVAEEYAARVGHDYVPPVGQVKYDRALGKALAKAHEEIPHSPDDPEVQQSYGAFKDELVEQFNSIQEAGYDLEPIISVESPYRHGSDVARDVVDNKHMFFNLSESAFGDRPLSEQGTNLMLEPSGIALHGKELSYNDLFRAVHDFFGHTPKGVSFGPQGEFNAWREHAALFSDAAQGALATESIGQTAWQNLRPELLNEAGGLIEPGKPGFKPRRDRPYAEQKNYVMPQEIIDRAIAKLAPKKDNFKLKPPGAGFSKAWILPSGEPVQLGGKWHHQWLAENPEVAAKYKLSVPDFKGSDIEGVRESALKAGFARVNHSQNSGTLTIEARAKDWRRIKPAIERMVEANLDNIDNMTVTLLNESASKVTDSQSAKLFNYDDAEKLQHLPFITEGEPRGQLAPKKVPSDSEATAALREPKRRFFGAHRSLEAGTPIGVRIDIPAWEDKGIYVQAIHEQRSKEGTGKTIGNRIGYDGMVTIDDPVLLSNEAGAETIRSGERKKFPVATIEGKYDPSREIPDVTDWTEVGYNPKKHSYFYEKGTDELVLSGSKAVSVGNSVFVKDAVFGDKSTAAFAPRKAPIPKTPEEVRKIAADEVVRMATNHPEALPLNYQKNADGTFKLKDNAPIGIEKNYELHDTPLARAAAASHETKEAKEAAIVDAYAEKIKEAHAEAAKNPAILAGKDWYELTRKKLLKLFGVDTKLFTEILGATSANTPVDTNFRFAIDAYNKFKAGDYEGILKKYKEGKAMWDSGDLSAARALDTENFLGENPTRARFREFWIKHHDLKPKQSNGNLFGFNSAAVLRVFDGSWRAEIEGPKTPNFADNLSGDSFEATIDIWAARLMRRMGYEGSEGPWRILAKNEAGVSDKDFFMSQRAFRKAGDELGISPDSLQAIVWFLEKDLWDKSGWTKAVGAKKSDFNVLLDITARASGSDKLSIDEIRPKPRKRAKAQLAPEQGLVEPKKPSAIVAMPQEDAEKIADAIYKAEGGAKAKKPYGILSVKVANEAEARRVALNTIKNNYKRWQAAGKPGGYLEFLAGKYAPIGVANDPKSLNQNWLKNVKSGLKNSGVVVK